jgi:colicin import membrane protein
MNRLQKKCFFASAGFHLLLLVILLVGPAFLVSKSKPDNAPVLDFVPLKTVDALISGGGNPNATPPPAALDKAPAAQPTPPVKAAPPTPAEEPKEVTPPKEPVKEVTPPKDEVQETAPPKDEESFVPEKDRKPKKSDIEFKPVTRNARDLKAEAKARAEAEAREQQQEYDRLATERRRRLDAAFGNAVGSLQEGRSGSTSIELKGPGGGGVPYANFLQAVKSRYQQAWIVPDGITDENATVAVSVTIARDGTVVSSRITRSSSNAAVDRSVQVTLDRVKWAAPLPEDAKEDRRTVSINFNVAAKRASG